MSLWTVGLQDRTLRSPVSCCVLSIPREAKEGGNMHISFVRIVWNMLIHCGAELKIMNTVSHGEATSCGLFCFGI